MNQLSNHYLPMPASAQQPASSTAQAPEHIGQIYESAPLCLRVAVLEHLLKPLGILALVSIANGIFAKIRFRNGHYDACVRAEDAALVNARDVVLLAERVQQVSIETIDSLMQMLSSTPAIASSTITVPQVTADQCCCSRHDRRREHRTQTHRPRSQDRRHSV